MKIIPNKQAIHKSKSAGTDLHYYLFNDYEIIYVEQKPHTTDTWHHHEVIWETIYLIKGELLVEWHDGEAERSQTVGPGDVIEAEKTPHTLVNNSDQVVRLITFKHIREKDNFRKTFETDKVLD